MRPIKNLTRVTRGYYWHKNRQIDQWNIKESPITDSHLYSHKIYSKSAVAVQWEKNVQENFPESIKYLYEGREMNLYSFLSYHLTISYPTYSFFSSFLSTEYFLLLSFSPLIVS